MKLLLGFLIISLTTFALEFEDKMTAKVLKAYKKNYLVINRGLEDGIMKGEHIKLTNKAGYVSRAICIKPRMLISHCKVYRVVHPELLSLDSTYTLSSIKQSEMPKDLAHLRFKDFSKQYNDFTDSDINKNLPIQNERIANFDLVNDFDPDKYPLLREEQPSKIETALNKNLNKDLFKEDISRFSVHFFASPLSFQKHGGQYNHDFGVRAKNNGKKYDFDLQARINNAKVSNQYTKQSITKKESIFRGIFELKDFSENTTLLSMALYRDQNFDGIQTPLSTLRVSPIGIKYLIHNTQKRHFSVSLSPVFDSTKFHSQTENKKVSESYIRYGLGIFSNSKLSKKSQIDFAINYLPSFDFKENISEIDTTFLFSLTKNFSFSYSIGHYSNSLIGKHYQLESSDIRNTVNFNYKINL